MLVVALTGNIASGKSEAAKLFGRHGATIIDADVLAREAVEPGRPAYDAIVARWGRRVLLPDESIDRRALGEIVFNDAVERDALNAIVHPRVLALRDHRLDEARRRGDQVVIADIPLLFETGLDADFDRVVLVDAPESMRLERLMRGRGLSRDAALRMISAQMPSSAKRARADDIIDNTGTLEDLALRVDDVWRHFPRPVAS